MRFTPTALDGVWVIDLDLHEDERGFFARSWCQREFQEHGLASSLVQCSISFNRRRGTLRGLHYQALPHGEAKLIRVTHGAIYDVAVDVRPGSPTWLRWHSVRLTQENRRMLYIAAGIAHGFQTLQDDTEVFYQMNEFYRAESARGVRFDDPALGIPWPVHEKIVTEKDRSYEDIDASAVSR